MGIRTAALTGAVLALLALGFMAIFNVPVDSEALVLRGSDVQRKVGPGIQVHIPLVEQIVIEPVLRERQFIFDEPFEIQGCQAEIALIYRIGDLETYHADAGNPAVLQDKRQDLDMALSDLPDLSNFNEAATPYGTRIADRLTSITGPAEGGLYINRVNVSMNEGCEPRRIVKQEPMARIIAEPVGKLAPERATPGSSRATTTDGVELQIDGLVATYEITDETRGDNCFGANSNLIAARVGTLADRAAIAAISDMPLDRLAEFPARLQTALADNDLDQCGLALGAVDFSKATLARRSVVNCDETQDDACKHNTLAFPGFSVLLRP
ncbi:MAG: hypothetical protein AAGC96_08185 [Pseudomonadota bacterium]